MTKRPDIYQEVTDRVIELIESGQATGDWTKPWRAAAGEGMPVNAVTHRTYRGINVLLLWSGAMERGYTTNEWATYRQWQSRGVQVRKAERGERIVFFKTIERPDEDDDEKTKRIPYLRFSRVFNAEQVDGYEPETIDTDDLSPVEREGLADEFIDGLGADVRHGGGRAFYNETQDYVQLPDIERFAETEAYYGVAFHELTHWTGHSTRLDRSLAGRFGDQAYAAEELIAELGAAFICGTLGLEPHARDDHAEYVANWLTLLKSDRKAIVTAASKASDAADYLHELAAHEAKEAAPA